jgi:hypothetical protein
MEAKQRGHPSIRTANTKGPSYADIAMELGKAFLGAAGEMYYMPQQVMRGEKQVMGADGRVTDDAIRWGADMAGTMTLGSGAVPAQVNTLRAGATVRNAPPIERAKTMGGKRMAPDPEGIRAYHGSPHDFDKFSMDKIGTGEGAQAYGHGLYFADSEDVARGYRDRLTSMNASAAQRSVNYRNGDVAAAIDDAKRKIAVYSEKVKDPDAPDLAHRLLAINKQKLADLEAGVDQLGSMYEVRIKANPDDFLDWDKPLSEQPGIAKRLGLSVRPENDIHDEALKLMQAGNEKAGRAGGWMDDPVIAARVEELQSELDRIVPNMRGEEYYRGGSDTDITNLLSQMGRGDHVGASSRLNEAGIPGIKYLDAGSRAAGDGSRNYVVFDDSLIEIVKKYGIAGALSAGLLTQEQASQMQSQAGMSQGQWEAAYKAGNAT